MVLVLAAALGIGYAAIPGDDGVIHACYDAGPQRYGTLRVVDPNAGGKCAKNENALAWNQTGPTGPTGPAGSTGTSQGFVVREPDNGAPVLPNTEAVVLSKAVPAGKYIVHASFTPKNFALVHTRVDCWFDPGASNTSVVLDDYNTPGSSESMSLDDGVTLSAAGTIEVRCRAFTTGDAGVVILVGRALTAIKVDSIG